MHCFLDYRTSKEEILNLTKLNINPIIIPKTNLVYDAINGHVDIQLNILDKKSKTVIVHKNISNTFLEELNKNHINYCLSNNSLGYNYPKNIILNGLILENHFIHNTKYTDETLLSLMKNKKIINVKQGYTKCSIIPISDNSLITNDIGIYNTLIKENFDILFLPPGDILLPSLNYGFIGGVGGMISKNKLALFGSLKDYSFGDDLYRFLYKHDIEPISLRKGKLIDRGSLLTI